MPPILLIAGVPQKIYQRTKHINFEVPSWSVRILASPNKDRPEWSGGFADRVLTEVLAHPGGGHVLAFGEEGKKEPWSQRLRVHLRVRWLNNHNLYLLTSDPASFGLMLRAEAQFETEWRSRVRPVDDRSPLLLPGPDCFLPVAYSQLWDKAKTVGPSSHPGGPLRELTQVAQQIDGFRQTHHYFDSARRKDGWRDRRDLIFTADEWHAVPPEQWNWKFSFRVVDGFHYNVNHVKGRSFLLTCFDGTVHRQKSGQHVNVDCHGSCRE